MGDRLQPPLPVDVKCAPRAVRKSASKSRRIELRPSCSVLAKRILPFADPAEFTATMRMPKMEAGSNFAIVTCEVSRST